MVDPPMLTNTLAGPTYVLAKRTFDPIIVDGQSLDGVLDVCGQHARLILHLVPLINDNLLYLPCNALGDAINAIALT